MMNETDNGLLYAWQQDCLAKWKKHHRRGIVNAITGSGKTILAIAAVQDVIQLHPDLRIRIVVPTLPLTRQWAAALLQAGFAKDDIGFFHGGRKDTPDLPCMIYVINSARYNLSRHILQDFSNGHAVLLIADECHHYGSNENRKIFDFLSAMPNGTNHYYSMGLSATPFSLQNRSVLEDGLGSEIYRYNATQAVSENVISPFHIFEIALSFAPEEWDDYQKISLRMSTVYRKLISAFPSLKNMNGEAFFSAVQRLKIDEDAESDSLASLYLRLSYLRKEISTSANSRIRCALKLISLLREDTRILVFCERISQAESLYRQLSHVLPNRSGLYHSQMTAEVRKNVLANFRDHNIRILVSCRCLDEGMDVPDASTAIVLSSTALERQRLQRLGRILRHTSKKDIASLYYLYLKDSSDDCIYLSSQNHATVSHLRFLSEEDDFIHPAYENAAAHLLSELERQHAASDVIHEFKRCISEGIVRSDWGLPPKICQQHQMDATTQHEKNYWICMEKLKS